ncbi:MAG: alkaline phosphatase D family protein [Rikenellaceae bacterium]
MRNIFKSLAALLLLAIITPSHAAWYQGKKPSADSVYFSTGFKVGDVTPTSAVIWTRLCSEPKPVGIHHERMDKEFRSPIKFNRSAPVSEWEGYVGGSYGQVLIELSTVRNQRVSSGWQFVSGYKDFTYKQRFDGLLPNTKYRVQIMGCKDTGSPVTHIEGEFTTAPAPNQEAAICFTSVSCQYYWDYDDEHRGFKVYDAMAKLKPSFISHTGDYVYYDKAPAANTIEQARHKWQANNSWSGTVDFYRTTPCIMQADDHDILRDDASPGSRPMLDMTFEDGVAIWEEQSPFIGETYRTFRWGKDLQVWAVDGRKFRDDNWVEDGKDKTIWGKEQCEWFERTVKQSDATFKILLSPTPVVGPDRETKRDNHANPPFKHEGDWLRKLLAANNMYVINGDRHWQYVSVDKQTGVMEFSQGPQSDSHAGGWKQSELMPEHKFLRVKGGFLSVSVSRKDKKPQIIFRHHDVDGNVVHEETILRKR